MKNFLEFDQKIPSSLRAYFKGLELRVVTQMAWTAGSLVPALLSEHLVNNLQVTHPALLMFCRSLLSHCALRIFELSQLLGLAETVYAQVWGVMKHVLSASIDLFVDRNVDQIVICCIYGSCKAMNVNMTFNSIITKYWECYSDGDNIFRYVFIDSSSPTGDIITFYNRVFIERVRSLLVQLNRNAPPDVYHPTISALNPSTDLTSHLPPPLFTYNTSPKKLFRTSGSPFVTPKSSGRYIFSESPTCSLDDINQLLQKNGNLIIELPQKGGRDRNEANGDELPDDFNRVG